MGDWKALKTAAVVVAGTAAFLLVGAALRFATRIISFVILALVAVGIGYATYELTAGWNAASTETKPTVDDHERLDHSSNADRRDRPVGAALSDSEFERELEELLDESDESRTAEADRNTETR